MNFYKSYSLLIEPKFNFGAWCNINSKYQPLKMSFSTVVVFKTQVNDIINHTIVLFSFSSWTWACLSHYDCYYEWWFPIHLSYLHFMLLYFYRYHHASLIMLMPIRMRGFKFWKGKTTPFYFINLLLCVDI